MYTQIYISLQQLHSSLKFQRQTVTGYPSTKEITSLVIWQVPKTGYILTTS